jgi:hypothetical protein
LSNATEAVNRLKFLIQRKKTLTFINPYFELIKEFQSFDKEASQKLEAFDFQQAIRNKGYDFAPEII